MNHDENDLGHNLSDAEAGEYEDIYRRGIDLLEPHIDLHGEAEVPSEKREDEIREGVRLLQRAVAIVPESWPAHWFLGKGHQALGDHERAYQAFRRAAGLCQDNADVPRELCLECLHLGRCAEAVAAARLAVRRNRSDPGLQANLALA